MRRGYTRVPNAVIYGEKPSPDGKPLTLSARVLYAVILDWANAGERPCTVSQVNLGQHLNLSSRHIRNLLQELEAAELVRVHREGRTVTNSVFPLVLPEGKRSSDHPRKPTSDNQDLPPTNNGNSGWVGRGADGRPEGPRT